MEADEGKGRGSYSPKYDSKGLIRPFSSLCSGLPPRKERWKGTTGEVDPLRVTPGLDGPDEDEDSVLAWRDDNGVGVSRLKSNDRELLSRKVLPCVSIEDNN